MVLKFFIVPLWSISTDHLQQQLESGVSLECRGRNVAWIVGNECLQMHLVL